MTDPKNGLRTEIASLNLDEQMRSQLIRAVDFGSDEEVEGVLKVLSDSRVELRMFVASMEAEAREAERLNRERAIEALPTDHGNPRVAIVADELRYGLESLFSHRSELIVVGSSRNSAGILEEMKPSIVFVELTPDITLTVDALKVRFPDVKIVLIGSQPDLMAASPRIARLRNIDSIMSTSMQDEDYIAQVRVVSAKR